MRPGPGTAIVAWAVAALPFVATCLYLWIYQDPGRYEDAFKLLFRSAVVSALCFVAVAVFYLASNVFRRH